MSNVRKTKYFCPVCDNPMYTKDGMYFFCEFPEHTKAVHIYSKNMANISRMSRSEIEKIAEQKSKKLKAIAELPLCGAEYAVKGMKVYWVQGIPERYKFIQKGLMESAGDSNDDEYLFAIDAERNSVVTLKKMSRNDIDYIADRLLDIRKTKFKNKKLKG